MEATAPQLAPAEVALESYLLKPHNDSLRTEEGLNQSLKRKREDAKGEADEEKVAKAESANGGEQRHPYWKTSLCSYFRRDAKSCRHGDTCRYAHGEDELHLRPDNTWDPTSKRAKTALMPDSSNGAGGGEDEEEDGEAEEDASEEEDGEFDGATSAKASGLMKCVMGLPMKWTCDQFKLFLAQQGILYEKATKKKKRTIGHVLFENEEQVAVAVKKLRDKTIGKKIIDVEDSIRKNQLSPAGLSVKPKSVREAACPLAHMPYGEQLEQKKSALSQLLKKLTRNVRKACPSIASPPEWIHKSRELGGLPCSLQGISPSPLINGYRNKCEFSVGYSRLGTKTVGFITGSFRDGNVTIEEAVDCPNISQISYKYTTIFQCFLQSSALPVWNKLNNSGFWRQFTVREGRNPNQSDAIECVESEIAEVMLFVQVCSLGVDKEVMDCEFQKMAKSFVEGASACLPPMPLTVIAVQDNKGVSDSAPADSPILTLTIPETSGNPCPYSQCCEAIIHDYICGLKFSISPTAFFQVNTLAAEKLYMLAGDWACLNSKTLLFDICCGTGTIGLTLAHRVGMVIGIEMNNSAVSDATRNAEANGIKNCKFICAKAEDVMGAVLEEYLDSKRKCCETVVGCCSSKEKESDSKLLSDFEDVVAIVDPPRAGLHPTVIKALRTHPRVRRLVYISCNPESLVANAIELCTPTLEKPQKAESNHWFKRTSIAGFARRRVKSMPNSEPFSPMRAMAFDLFPHTPHCEMVMLFER